ncbi:hypothetical protein GUITHDRAFT_148851 [Guillardia theta CCMP2712]|uniref:PDEase domain-containing protein n=1 Tax=Guillardia theta (strain CCMP2712) TaxID=905079 RepID=L1I8B9_GUITC|nr:hypothetical protein GUITHDRAFT_148851 [Guillardia theta CCMP2712]EKX32100.1 hypothetical protein GUITHDRAFT_148851 [Guillardia theta CCMP2712]|eukprot:XP_005819080.1 hypothetical protein GUITHDRAFT_148851 [Guillardia theta CCMP2712]
MSCVAPGLDAADGIMPPSATLSWPQRSGAMKRTGNRKLGRSLSIKALEDEGGLQQPEFISRKSGDFPVSLTCLSAVANMQDNGKFGEAQQELEDIVSGSKSRREMAMACLLLGELFNRWGSCSQSYSIEIMAKGAMYASRAVQLYKEDDSDMDIEFRKFSLYWKAINCASVASLGGCNTWSADAAMQEAEIAMQEMSLTRINSTPKQVMEDGGYQDFVHGMLIYCKALGVERGYFTLKDGKDLNSLLLESLQMFQDSYEKLIASCGELNNQTVKTVTMISTMNKMLGNKEEAIRWAEKEVHLRNKLHGDLNVRTQIAKKKLEEMTGIQEADEAEEEDDPSLYGSSLIDPSEIVWSLNPFELTREYKINCILQMFKCSGLSELFNIPEDRLLRFVLKVRKSYHEENAFHNWKHAWSVTVCGFLIMQEIGAEKFLLPTDRLAILIACIIHDIDHPGYPVLNVLEHMHWSRGKELLSEGCDTDILVNTTAEQRKEILDQIYEGIMSTDMQNHKQIVKEMEARVEEQKSYDINIPRDRVELVQAIVHCADLSGQTLEPEVAYQFGRGVMEEFHIQSQREKNENLMETPFMKGLHKPLAQAKAQLGFLHYVVGPLWKSLAIIFPQLSLRSERIEERCSEIDFEKLDVWKGKHEGLQNMHVEDLFD